MNLPKLLSPFSRRENDSNEFDDGTVRIRPVFFVREEKEGFAVTVDLPGVRKEGLDVNVEQNQLIIIGRQNSIPPSDWTVLYRETAQADFGLKLDHQGVIDTEKIRAELKDGVLHLTLPKHEALKPLRISIE
jgi:HSP20 family protein